MIYILCGHRGVGKTSLLNRLKKSFEDLQIYDLDEEIEKNTRKKISEIFSQFGEAEFRRLEIENFMRITVAQNLNLKVASKLTQKMDHEVHHEMDHEVHQQVDHDVNHQADREVHHKIDHEVGHEVANRRVVISVGGGFDVSQLSGEFFVIFVTRRTDTVGKVFLDRPRLNTQMSALDEYKLKWQDREPRFLSRADFIYPMLEGMTVAGPALLFKEVRFFENLFTAAEVDLEPKTHQRVGLAQVESLILTLESHFKPELFKTKVLLAWAQLLGISIELRDDLHDEKSLESFLCNENPRLFILSFRKRDQSSNSLRLLRSSPVKAVDWALELGEVPLELQRVLAARVSDLSELIISCHEPEVGLNITKLREAHARISSSAKKAILKSSPMLNGFDELGEVLDLQAKLAEEKISLSFLPRSAGGRWNWLRTWLSQRQVLNYIRIGAGSALDQPTVMEQWSWCGRDMAHPDRRVHSVPQRFAAVLGNPVQHSFSPSYHHDFFSQQGFSFFPICIEQAEWPLAISQLVRMNLAAAAITAPLKEDIYKWFEGHAPATMMARTEAASAAQRFGSANTLMIPHHSSTEGLQVANTDLIGFQRGFNMSSPAQVVIWGGGGTLAMLQELLPQAQVCSASKLMADESFAKVAKSWCPSILVWAAPRREKMIFPPKEWPLTEIIDLNYAENSPGRELALERGLKYQSGLAMFIEQAREQQEIWRQIYAGK